ncbi:ABC transporter ATP-binding protein [Cellulomonas aerilata]|uniref:ABC transporter n=1 Tax=Cellulomonas aerilata TaxID=515326 RepID=A0A512DF70_9CELL|nr:ABC transporter ATP-binding protein [Cellulomonas aerilata]GEO35128.1 ABC transporter [Cellulomonas aerilata]
MTAPSHRRPPSRIGAPPALLDVVGFTKSFGDVHANTDVDLSVQRGEVHALAGENGAGKSTLLKMIFGVYEPDAGRMFVDGQPVTPGNPAHARALGIGMVFQDLRLVPALTVAENVALSLRTGFRLRMDGLVRRIEEASRSYGLDVDPRAQVRTLSIGERQRVEILKTLMAGARLVILDEPTSVLAPQEVQSLFEVVERLKAEGLGVVIVTHKLNEVRAIADRMTILRRGEVVLNAVAPADYTDGALIEAMVGRAVAPLPRQRRPVDPAGRTLLALSDVRTDGDRGYEALKGIDLDVRAGELVGIAGVAGSGQRELFEVVLGLRPLTSGHVEVRDVDGVPARPRVAAAIPEDPVADSVVPGLSVLQHMVLDGREVPRKGVGVDWAEVGRRTAEADAKVGLDIAAPRRTLSGLSGGNIQRVVLTRELSTFSPVVVAAYPSRGLDIANARRTQEVLLEQRAAGAAVLMVSEDLEELISMADRIVVMHDGHVAGVVAAADADRMALGRLMLGGAA